jgi:predicted ribosome quality control (RQC) complex YloA/Tae2 family protein
MELQSIIKISTSKDNLKEALDNLDWGQFADQKFGNENEYSFKGILGGLQSILTDINSLINNPDFFLKLTTYNERTTIKEKLDLCISYIEKPNYLYEYLDELKVLLRPLQLRYSKLRSVEFSKEISEVLKQKLELIEVINQLKKLKEDAIKLLQEIKNNKENSTEKLNEFDESFTKLEDKENEVEKKLEILVKKVDTLDKTLEDIEEKQEQVTISTQEVKSNEKLILTFSNRVESREKQIEKIQIATDEYLEKLNIYTNERKKILSEANELIESSKQALNYKTAEGLSASFKAQYDEEKNSKPNTWIIASLGCLAAALGIGIWIILDKDNLEMIIGRIVLIPLPITGAIFCANQYIKRQNIIQDYAYKMVLAKSIVGFSEQFKKYETENGEYSNYLRKALEEIHQDPLRKRGKESNEKDEIKIDDKLDKILDFAKQAFKDKT